MFNNFETQLKADHKNIVSVSNLNDENTAKDCLHTIVKFEDIELLEVGYYEDSEFGKIFYATSLTGRGVESSDQNDVTTYIRNL